MRKLIFFMTMFFVTTMASANTQVPAKDVSVNTAPFNKNLGPADVNVQHALQTLDQLSGGGGGSSTWGSITGTLSNQTDLQNALNAKQDALTFTDSVINTSGAIMLSGDSALPGNSKYYGTDSIGAKGFFDLPTSAVWGSITGTLSDQTDLATALSGKVATTTTISTTSPLSGGGDLSANRTISIPKATGTADGYLSSTDWTTFNNKQSTITTGNLTESTSAVLTVTGGTGAVIGSGTSIQVKQAGTAQSGYLSSTDWNTFNNKGSGTVTSVSGTSPIASSGGNTPAISIANAAADGSTKGAAAFTAADFDAASGVISLDYTNGQKATSLVPGFLSSTDWTTFNGKQSTISAGAGIGISGSTVSTDSTKQSFLASGALTCGASTNGKMQVHTTPLQYCDNAATPTLQYAAYGSSTGVATSATILAMARGIYGNNFDGSTALTQIIASTYGGTGNGFTKFSGPTTSEKTFTLPNASANILTDNAVVTVSQGGSGAGTLTGILKGNGTSAFTAVAAPSGSIVGTTDTQTLTNKRLTARVVVAADATSISPNTDNADMTTQSNSQATGTLTINADSGTPTNGQKWILRLTSTNVQTFAWNSIYTGSNDLPLPTTSTGSSKVDYYGFIYSTDSSKWNLIAVNSGF